MIKLDILEVYYDKNRYIRTSEVYQDKIRYVRSL